MAHRRNRDWTAAVARAAISDWLERQQRNLLKQHIAEYAVGVGGTQDDMDPALERAGIETITKGTGRARHR